MAGAFAGLREMCYDEVVALYDKHAGHTHVGLNHYRDELVRRDQERQTDAMLRYTRWITLMTVIMTASPLLLHHADRVVFLVDGRAAGIGTHEELLATHADYRRVVARDLEDDGATAREDQLPDICVDIFHHGIVHDLRQVVVQSNRLNVPSGD